MRIGVFVALGFLLAVQRPISAHHSFAAEFDATKPLKITGPVTKVEWTNPHVWIYLDVKDETGASTNWAMEMGSPNGLLRTGWTRNSLKAGDVVTVEGYRARGREQTGNASAITLASTGKKLFAGSSGPGQ